MLDPRPGRTGAGLAREAGAVLPDIAAELDAVVDAFDASGSAGARPMADDVARAHRLADDVRSARISASRDAVTTDPGAAPGRLDLAPAAALVRRSAAVLAVGAVIVTAIASTASAHAPLDPVPRPTTAAGRWLGCSNNAAPRCRSSARPPTPPPGRRATTVARRRLRTTWAAISCDALKGHRIVLIDPDVAALAAFTGDYQSDSTTGPDPVAAGCSWPGGRATGAVTFPDRHDDLPRAQPLLRRRGRDHRSAGRLGLGRPAAKRPAGQQQHRRARHQLDLGRRDGRRRGLAAARHRDTGGGSPSIWSLFPPWTQRAFWWLLVVGVLVALWRGRRFGPVVTEPLPVVVRSAEVVEGHGRLYRRAAGPRPGGRAAAGGRRHPAGEPARARPAGRCRPGGGRAATPRRPAPARPMRSLGPVPADDRGDWSGSPTSSAN